MKLTNLCYLLYHRHARKRKPDKPTSYKTSRSDWDVHPLLSQTKCSEHRQQSLLALVEGIRHLALRRWDTHTTVAYCLSIALLRRLKGSKLLSKDFDLAWFCNFHLDDSETGLFHTTSSSTLELLWSSVYAQSLSAVSISARQMTSWRSFKTKPSWSYHGVLESPNPFKLLTTQQLCNTKPLIISRSPPTTLLLRPVSFDVRPIQPIQAVDLCVNKLCLSLRWSKGPSNQWV